MAFAVASSLTISSATMRIALDSSRKPIEGAPKRLIDACAAAWQEGRNIVDVVIDHGFAEFLVRDVVAFARGIHDAALVDSAVASLPMSDLVASIDEWEEPIASCVYLGLMASAYFLPGSLIPRWVAESPQMQALLERQASDYGRAPVEAVAKKLRTSTPRPIYIPTTSDETVVVRLRHENIDDKILISNILINDVPVFEAAQGHADLKLRELLGAERADADAIAHAVCRVYAIPFGRITVVDVPHQEFEISTTAGLISPKAVPRTKDKS